jgi:hypothetical protein
MWSNPQGGEQFIRHVKKNGKRYIFSGSGATNDSYNAYTCFKNPSPFSAVTGVNERLVARFGTTRQIISSDFPIENETCDQYSKETIVLCL